MRAPKGYVISRSRRPPLPDPHFAGPLGRRFWAPQRCTPWHRRPSYDLRRAPCDHPDFIHNALRGGFIQRFLKLNHSSSNCIDRTALITHTMTIMEKLITFITFLLLSYGAQAMVQGKEVTYNNDDEILKGYIAYDDAIKGKRPGVLVVHEWWGHNEYARKRARMLAELGYTALALDMYGDGKQAHHPDEAGKFAGEVAKNMPLAKARFEAAMKFLKEQP